MASRKDDYPDLGPRDTKPIATPRSWASHLRLTPKEGFVLSRVDGKTSYEQICQMTGLGLDASLEILRKLRRERLILHPGESAKTPPPVTAGPNRRRTRSGVSTRVPLLQLHDDGSDVDKSLLKQGTGLDADTKARILRLHKRMRGMKPHELLGVSPGADGATVKRAYFAASKELHPDRFYGLDLGPYRDKLSDIFSQLTHAFEQCKK
ncbi:MAG TPA: J domain-containing protein [Polyangia bacterium]